MGGTVASGSPYAVGHLINHPQAGVLPNVGRQEFDWDPSWACMAANRLHHGVWYLDPVTSDLIEMPQKDGKVAFPVLPGVAIVALRDIFLGEELYMDYRLSRPHPPWYTPVHER